jgi:ADP-dependent NAD(P)H-hydrate dehydratase
MPSRRRKGRRERAPIVITRGLLKRWPLPSPDGLLGKEGRGSVMVVGGCREVPGAVMLGGLAALRVGAGRLWIATAQAIAPAVACAVPEARVTGLRQQRNGELHPLATAGQRRKFGQCDAVLVGPGMGPDSAAAARELLRGAQGPGAKPPIVVDAGALGVLEPGEGAGRGGSSLILTPHAGELARVLGIARAAVTANPLAIARRAARVFDAVVVLKGEQTYVAAPDGRAYLNQRGTSGLGTSGSGDVLAGAIAGLCARGADPLQAAVWAVFIHAEAGEALARRIGPLGFLARELLDELPRLVSR